MKTIEELRAELKQKVAEVRALLGQADKTEERKKAMEAVRSIQAELAEAEELRGIDEAIRDVPAPPTSEEQRAKKGWAEVRSALNEKRALTANGAGAVAVVNDIFKAFVDKNKIASRVKKFTGANASTVIPIFSPHLAMPAKQTEGGTGIGADATAVLGTKSLTPYPYFSILAVSHMALLTTPIETALPEIFRDAYAGAIDKAILVGTAVADGGLGVFVADAAGVTTSQDVPAAAAGAPKIADLVKLIVNAIAATDQPENVAVVMHPTTYANFLNDTTAEFLVIKQQLILMQCMGVPIILSTYVPSVTTAGTYVAVAGDFSQYAMAVAAELNIDKINVVGSDNITFQSWMYMNFRPIQGDRFRRLKTI
jgi:HK97 family phage major capsid protein